MRNSRLKARLTALTLVGALTASLGGGPMAALGASGDPPTIIFAGETDSAPFYDHVVVLYDKRLDESVPIPLGDFTITVDGVASAPASASYLITGLVGLFSESGSTFLRLNLPAGMTIGAASTFQVDYSPGAAPLRDRSLTAAISESEPGQFGAFGDFALVGALIDAGNAANRLTIIFTGQVDLTSVPAPGDFAVSIDGSPISVSSVEPRVPDLGMGFVDLVLPISVTSGGVVDLTYTPGPNLFRARNGGLVLAGFSQAGITVFLPPTTASQIVAPGGGTVSTGTGTPPSPADPLTTAVTTADGGLVTINETPADPAPAGYTFFGEQVQITAPPAVDPTQPLVLVFSIDATLVPTGQDENSIALFRNGTPLADCTTDPISSPCIASRLALDGGDIQITVKALAASRWNFGVVAPYAFSGFKPPVDGGGVRNLAKAGSAIPVKFSLGGNRGLLIFTAGSPASQQVACDSSSPLDAIEQTVSAGASSLSYAAGSDTYAYIWKTDTAWTGCRLLTLSFGDGSRQSALFEFR